MTRARGRTSAPFAAAVAESLLAPLHLSAASGVI